MAQLLLPNLPHRVQKPDYRNNGCYQFIVGYTGGGAAECQHLTKEQIIQQLTERYGVGEFYDDGVDLWWTLKEQS